jgi:prevent-host-death family protein
MQSTYIRIDTKWYAIGMDVAVTELRAHLADYIERVRAGEEVVVVQHGFPVARISGIDSSGVIERLTREGVIRRPDNPVKVTAKGRVRVVPKPGAPVSDWIADQRDAR